MKTNYQQISQSRAPSHNKLEPQVSGGSLLNPRPLLQSLSPLPHPPPHLQMCPGAKGGGWASGTYFHSNFKFKLCSNPLEPSE